MKKRTFPRAVAYAGCVIFALTTAALAQTSDPKDVTVQVRHDSKDSKAVPITQEKEPSVIFLLETGYETQYNFRGTNLMPNADGGFFYQVQATVPRVGPGSLTFGVWAIHQQGDAVADTWSISEGGGGGGNAGSQAGVLGGGETTFTRFPRTTQTDFTEFDLFVSYKFSLGPVDVTFGNIMFLIDREAQTFEKDVLQPGFIWIHPPTLTDTRILGPVPTVQGEQFDRIYVRLSSSKIRYVTPSITYYQTIYSEGDDPTFAGTLFFPLDEGIPGGIPELGIPPIPPARPSVNPAPNNMRNDELGGYLEARVNGNIPVGEWLDINPYALISYSFKDRTEPAVGFAGSPLTGWNHVQAGLELDFHITPHIAIVPFAAYSHHLANPPIGTDEDEFWGGLKVAVNLW